MYLDNTLVLFTALVAFASIPHVVCVKPRYDTDLWKRMTRRADTVNWTECDGFDERFQCALFEIPLDYADPSAGVGQLAVAKLLAPNQRVGTLFTNPGGPGGSGVESVLFGGEELLNFTGGMYDIVSWDPRGVGSSFPGPINCFSDVDEYLSYWSGSIDFNFEVRGNLTSEEDLDYFYGSMDDFERRTKGLEEQCAQFPSGEHMAYVGSVATVRDMVALADAIDGSDVPINYWGFSYGTLLGNYFVNMFPDRVGRVLLDGIVDPISHSSERADVSWSHLVESADEAFQGFANGCSMAGPTGCKLADPQVNGGKDVMSWAQDLINLAYDLSMAGLVDSWYSTSLRAQIHQAMYTPQDWASFANETLFQEWIFLSNIAEQNANTLTRRSENTRRDKRQDDLSTFPDMSYEAIACGDSVDAGVVTTREVFDELVRVTREVSGTFGPQFPQPAHKCHIWPFRAVERYAGPFNSSLANPVLVIGNTADPSTPFKDAKLVADMLGDSAVLIEQQGFGHVTLAQKSQCITNILVDFFVDGKTPQGDATKCAVDDTAQLFGTKGVTAAEIANTTSQSSQAAEAEKKKLLQEKKTLLALTVVFAVIATILTGVVVFQFLRSRRGRTRYMDVTSQSNWRPNLYGPPITSP